MFDILWSCTAKRFNNDKVISFSEVENPEEIKPPKARKVLIFTFNRKYDNYFHT